MSAARRGSRRGRQPKRSRSSANSVRGAAVRRSDGRSLVGWLTLAAAAVGLVALGIVIGRSGFGSAAESAPNPRDSSASAAEARDRVRGDSGTKVAGLTSEAPLGDRAGNTRGVEPADRVSRDVALEPPAPVRRIALVIDDLGRDLEPLEQLSALGVPVSYAVLPFESMTEEVVTWLRRGGHEILVHLPMQAQGSADPGPGALYTNLGAERLRERTRKALDAVPGAVGVNNHMGSAFTVDPTKMQPVLQEIARREMFFLDSRTSGRSVAFEMALDLGIPSARRSVFLDNQPDVEAISRQFDEVLTIAEQSGSAIAIGHPYPSTLEALARRVPEARARGFEFVPVSYLLERSGLPGS